MNTQTLERGAGALRLPARALLAGGGGLLIGLGWAVVQGGTYRPGSDLGYALGIVGGIMMLILLLYPLRKHARFMAGTGPMRHWFRMHMALGIGGPLAILFHSSFSPSSLNGRVALYSMLLVAGSGIVGRYVHTRVHHGLYGRRASLREMQQELTASAEGVKSLLALAPGVGSRLLGYDLFAFCPTPNPLRSVARFLCLGWRGKWVAWQCRRDLRRALLQEARARQWGKVKRRRRLSAARRKVDHHVRAVRSVAQFAAYERLLRLWHVLHVPLVFLLAASSMIHVLAVHMY